MPKTFPHTQSSFSLQYDSCAVVFLHFSFGLAFAQDTQFLHVHIHTCHRFFVIDFLNCIQNNFFSFLLHLISLYHRNFQFFSSSSLICYIFTMKIPMDFLCNKIMLIQSITCRHTDWLKCKWWFWFWVWWDFFVHLLIPQWWWTVDKQQKNFFFETKHTDRIDCDGQIVQTLFFSFVCLQVEKHQINIVLFSVFSLLFDRPIWCCFSANTWLR